jgi:carbamoyl-phosphate synthase small subunit
MTGVDTRALTKKLREHGVMLGRMISGDAEDPRPKIQDPNERNLVAEVSCKKLVTYEPHENAIGKAVVVYDCGIKNDILRSFLKRGITVHRVPWDFDLSTCDIPYDAIFVSNGPGDPKKCEETIKQIQWSLGKNIPTFGICLGNQLLALAIGGDTYKLKYGHRGVNQPCIEHDERGEPTQKCIITSQNHGFAVKPELPKGWHVWFTNANDGTVEGIRHESGRFFSVQFHPEATPGPEDANYLFDEFVGKL